MLTKFFQECEFKNSYTFGMEIYIEYVLIDNLVINYLILLCVKNTMTLKTSRLNMIFSSVIGTAVACVLPLLGLSNFIVVPIKLLLGLLMVFVVSNYVSFKEYMFAFLLFILYTFLLGGACIGTLLLFGTNIETLSSGGYDGIVPVGIIMLIVSVYVYIIIRVARHLARKRVVTPFIRKVELYIADKKLELSAFIDSGNKLIDSKSGLPVIIISYEFLEKYFSKDTLELLMLENGKGVEKTFKNAHLTGYSTVQGDVKKMLVFEAEKLCIFTDSNEYTTNRFMVGVTFQKFKDAVKYDMLLNPAVL